MPHRASRSESSRASWRTPAHAAPIRGPATALALALLVLAAASTASAFTPAPAAAQDPASAPNDVSGRWMFVIESAEATTDSTAGSTTIAVPVDFEQDGETVTGTVQMPDIQGVQSAEITDGRYVDGTLTFVLRVGAGDQTFSAEVEARVEGDEMVGEAYVAGLQQTAVFRATRVG